jgi:hypothetical protein
VKPGDRAKLDQHQAAMKPIWADSVDQARATLADGADPTTVFYTLYLAGRDIEHNRLATVFAFALLREAQAAGCVR